MTTESDNVVVTELALVATPTVAQVPAMPTAVPISVSPGEKPEKFSGLNFKRWQQKMLFYLTTLNLARFLTEDAPKLKEDEHDIQVISAIDAWKHSDFLCRNYVMNGLADSLYNVYSDKKTAKELWESLDRKYKTKDAGANKFVVGRFLDYKMVDSKTVVSQVQELQVILHEIHAEGMMLSETFQVAAIIEKLPPAWKDFKNYLKHKRKEMSIEDLIIRLRIEEDNRRSEKKGAHTLNEAKANFVELPKKNKLKEANVIDDITKNVSDIDLTAVVSEVNLVGSNPKEWWIDTGATRHVCSDKKMFSTFEPIENGEKVFMGNSATFEIKGQGKVILKMTSGKELTLTNVLYVPEIRKNLVSGSLLNNHGFRLVFESNKFVLSKSGMYVGKGYMSDGMWKLNVMTIIKSNMNKASTSTYMLESSNLWHDDMLIVGSDDKMITSTKNMLNSRFDMKDMRLADVILGIKIKRTSDELVLSQSHYVDKILGKFDKDNSGVARTPVDVTLHLSKNKGESVSQVEYSRVIGSLMYLMSCTRPDIAYAVSKLSRYTSNPGAKHWQGIIRVLKYLRFTRDYGLHYTRYPAVLEGYSDANWISNVKDSKSHSGYVFTLGGAAVSWKSSKQMVIARSTMESEFIALDKCGEEAEWLRHFLEDIPRWSKPVPPICIHCDSQSAIGRAQSNMYNGKSKHIRRRHNTIRQLLSTGVISVDYVKSKDNIADPLTKGLNRELVEKSSRGMRLKPIKE
ncbi:hypothetical protein VitviT2T_006572 [Vitis vinifera]|uniref:Retrovirus-related Pol polyprotein from transposon TNT 1-94 n=2 Tax=Vitis vinifera TaxID=29760 RepID=A0ABY9BWH5_VITVI|nr:hypothetical protein VitviT2T_006572 [Vitis vinifera]